MAGKRGVGLRAWGPLVTLALVVLAAAYADAAREESRRLFVDHERGSTLALPHMTDIPGTAPVQVGNMCNPVTTQATLAVSHLVDSYETSDNLETALGLLATSLKLPATKYNASAPITATIELGTTHIDFMTPESGTGVIQTWLEPCWPSANLTMGLLDKKGIAYTNVTDAEQDNGGLWTLALEMGSSFWEVGYGYYFNSDNTEERLGRLKKFIVEGGGVLGVQFVQAIGISEGSATDAFSELQTLFEPVKTFNGGGYWQNGAGPGVYLIRDTSVVAAPGGVVNVDLHVRNFTAAVDVLTSEDLLLSNTNGFASIDLPLSFTFR
eukprot:CAMPEP_0114622620 /NCGR_PEP_ID=MMETSP0168-20121206/9831_1 /TAXON_ID=95228 ORGANISM="Vannella sp., Strain DIVA3 517/6/12" /NCGR_SAMPLE_ID=MMETSP0168 /ASSEMBLY_ACC=CAM_ASM_000044 /LENGTH=323 /DNA_ID=CAMNT_0001833841 /DNA_START=1 /DNA_END=969 /DNA_ORIENTATION=-